MFSFESFLPVDLPVSIVERFFVARGSLPEGVVLEDKTLPSIMQSVIIDFGGSPQQAVLPNGKQFLCAGDLIMGQFTRRYSSELSGNLYSIGIQMSPTGLYRLFRKPMTGFSNSICYLSDHATWHSALRGDLEHAITLEQRLSVLERYMKENLLMECSGSLQAVEQAARLMRDEHVSSSPGDIARMVGMSERNLQRYFLFYIGVTPKSFMRIARFNSVTRLIEQQETFKWQDILLATGYYDAAHFSREFKSITGRTPSDYYRGKAEYERFFYGI